jgi:polysaccharide export outer membrane protein
MHWKRLSRTGAVVALSTLLCACSGIWVPSVFRDSLRDVPSSVELESLAAEAKANYVIGESDVLRVTVWNHTQLSLDAVMVRPDGKISLPLLDDVQASGLSAHELKAVISERLVEYVSDPEITVVVLQVNSKSVYVLGEVKREGPILLRRDMRVVDVIAVAGGFSAFADRDNILIIRGQMEGAPQEFRFNYDTFVDGTDLAQDVLLLPGDKIVVP